MGRLLLPVELHPAQAGGPRREEVAVGHHQPAGHGQLRRPVLAGHGGPGPGQAGGEAPEGDEKRQGEHQRRRRAQHHRPAPQEVLTPLLPHGGEHREHQRRRRQHRQQQPLPLGGGVLHAGAGVESPAGAGPPGHAVLTARRHLAGRAHGGGAEGLRHTPVEAAQRPQAQKGQHRRDAPQGGRVAPLRQQHQRRLVQQRHRRGQQSRGMDAPCAGPEALHRRPEHRPAQDAGQHLGDQHTQGRVVQAGAEKGQADLHVLQHPGQPHQHHHRRGQRQPPAALPEPPLVPDRRFAGGRLVLRLGQGRAGGGLPALYRAALFFAPQLLQPAAQPLLPPLLLLLHRVHGAGHHVLHGDGRGRLLGLLPRLRFLSCLRRGRGGRLRSPLRLRRDESGGLLVLPVVQDEVVLAEELIPELLVQQRLLGEGLLRVPGLLRLAGRGFRRGGGLRSGLHRHLRFLREGIRRGRLRLRSLRSPAELRQNFLQAEAVHLGHVHAQQQPLGVHQWIVLGIVMFLFICHKKVLFPFAPPALSAAGAGPRTAAPPPPPRR